MKKLLLSCSLLFIASVSTAQVIFSIEEPASIQGFREFTSNGDGSNWGLATLVGFTPILEEVVLADDGTNGVNAQGNPASATGCNPLPANSLAGKIAMVYRGDGGTPGVGACGFGVKAKNCQDAGAVAVIIVNREEQLLNMDGGAVNEGQAVNIPVIFVKLSVGDDIKGRIENGDIVRALIGDKTGYYDDDLSLNPNRIIRPEFGAKPAALVQTASDFNLPISAFVYNFGGNDQTDVALNVVVKKDGVEVYNETSATELIEAGDSVLFTITPPFSLPTYTTGKYEVIYTAIMGSADEYVLDNEITTTFHITDSLWSIAGLSDVAEDVIKKDGYYRPATLPATSNEQCIVLRDPNIDRVALDGVYFGGFTINADDAATTSLDGYVLTWDLYQWDDLDKTVTNGTFNFLNTVASGMFSYDDNATNQAGKTVFAPIINDSYFRFESNKEYLLCVVNNQPKMFAAFSTTDYYEANFDNDDLMRFPMRNDFSTFVRAGFSSLPVPSIALRTGETLAINENQVEASAFPIPANDKITIKVGASGDAQLKIVDLSGKEVSNQTVKIVNGQFETSVAGINAGTYVFHLNYENGTSSRFKVVVSK